MKTNPKRINKEKVDRVIKSVKHYLMLILKITFELAYHLMLELAFHKMLEIACIELPKWFHLIR
jgi:hypothetical protein